MMNKRIGLIIVLIALVFNISYFGYASTDEEIIDIVGKEGIMQGTGNGFESEKSLTRAEMTVIAVKLKGIEDEAVATVSFDDVQNDYWANSYIGIASTYEIVKGTGNNKFSPNREVTLAETVTMIIRTVADYETIDANGTWPNNYMSYARKEGLLKDITLSSNDIINRIQTARIIANLISSPNWEGNTEKDKEVDIQEPEDKITTSVPGIGVILSVAASEDGFTLVELATPVGIKEYIVHGSELVAGTVLPGTYIDFWLSGTRMWDIIAEKIVNLGENEKKAKVYNLGDGTIKLVNKGETEPVILDRNNIIFLKCENMTLTEGVMEFKNLELGFEREIKLATVKDADTYDEIDGDEVFYHVTDINGQDVVVSIIYVK